MNETSKQDNKCYYRCRFRAHPLNSSKTNSTTQPDLVFSWYFRVRVIFLVLVLVLELTVIGNPSFDVLQWSGWHGGKCSGSLVFLSVFLFMLLSLVFFLSLLSFLFLLLLTTLPSIFFIGQVGMVGDAQVGKTTLMVKYVENKFDEEYIMTLGETMDHAFEALRPPKSHGSV